MIFIPGNTPSSKNSRQMGVYKNKAGKIIRGLIASPYTQAWKKSTVDVWLQEKGRFLNKIKDLPKPIVIGVSFVKRTNHKFDWHNAIQIIADTMQAYNWIANDDTSEVIFVPFTINGVHNNVDPKKPGAYIIVFKDYEFYNYDRTNIYSVH